MGISVSFVESFLFAAVYGWDRILFSDVPFMQNKNMYQVIRTGRMRWAAGQISVIFAQAFLLMAVNALFPMLLLAGSCEYTLEWGKLYHTLALTGGSEAYRLLFAFSYEAMQRFSPLELLGLTVLIGTLVIAFVGLLMFAVSLYINRSVAVTLAFLMVVMIYLVDGSFLLSVPEK